MNIYIYMYIVATFRKYILYTIYIYIYPHISTKLNHENIEVMLLHAQNLGFQIWRLRWVQNHSDIDDFVWGPNVRTSTRASSFNDVLSFLMF